MGGDLPRAGTREGTGAGTGAGTFPRAVAAGDRRALGTLHPSLFS